MDRHGDAADVLLAFTEPSSGVVWDVSRDSGGQVRFDAHRAVQNAARKINFRQTIAIAAGLAELALIVGLGFLASSLYPFDAYSRGNTFLHAFALVSAVFLVRQLIASAERDTLCVTPHPSVDILSLALGFAALLAGQALLGDTDLGWNAAWAAATIPAVALLRLGIWKSGWGMNGGGVAVIGEEASVRRVSEVLSRKGRSPVVGRFTSDAPLSIATVRGMAEDGQIEAVVLVSMPPAELRGLLDGVADLPIAVYLAPDPATTQAPLAPLIEVLPNLTAGHGGLAKRWLDLVLASAGLVLISPLLALVAIAIKLESPGPVFFVQVRFGLAGRAMEVWKFRTMYLDRGDATGEARTLARDPRVTRVGRVLRRLSIDELPQLLNVIRGDMSLVGPRPHAVRMMVEGQFYRDAVGTYLVRHRVKPGITGWAQVNGSRGEVDTLQKASRRVELDLWYIGNWSILLDLRILARTVLGGFATLHAD